jgi:adenosylcobinamide-GDP ribazoletransferase
VLLPASPFTPLVAAVLSTVASVLLTGGFHEDGLADVADGLGGSPDKARALQIMKDSRVGAFGAMALSLTLLCKVALVALLGSMETELLPLCSALFAAHVVSRSLPLLLIAWLPYAGDSAVSKSKPLADQINLNSLLTAFLWCFAALALVLYVQEPADLAVACSLSLIALLWMHRLFKRRLQGFTGDCLGATQQVCEIAFYLGLAIAL